MAAFFVTFPLCLFPLHLFGAQKQITVRFLDSASGKPIRKMWVTVSQYKGDLPNGPIPASNVVSKLSGRTDQKGEISATLGDQLPTYVWVFAPDLRNSGPLFHMAEVLQSGVLFSYDRKGNVPTMTPEPQAGEIVFVEKRLTTWDKMRQETP
jgi:hypothetical protein